MHPFGFRCIAVILLVLTTAWIVGCGSDVKRNAVSGTVKYKGTSIPKGSITFLTADGGVAGGAAIKDGAYEIPAAAGLPAGSYKVSISYPDPKRAPREPDPSEAPGVGDPAGGADMSREVRDLLPAKYNRNTELTAEVKDGAANEFPFDLK